MTLVASPIAGMRIRNCLSECISSAVRVRAAIAYADASHMALFEACESAKIPLDFYGRYDGTCAIHPKVLRWFLTRSNLDFRCHLVPNFLHAKVIWWVDAGAYIGSANLTDRAWNKNFEAGVFFSRDEIVSRGLDGELQEFFEQLHDQAHPLTSEVAEEQERLFKKLSDVEAKRYRIALDFDQESLLRSKPHPEEISSDKAESRRFKEFSREWSSTLQLMRDIALKVASNQWRPAWIPETVPAAAQADQFLHAYYYQKVKDGVHYPVEEMFKRNEGRREAELLAQLAWWKSGSYSYVDEYKHLVEWAPLIRQTFARERLAALDENSWVDAASCVHAIRDYAGKHSSQRLGSAVDLEHEQKVRQQCHILWGRKSEEGRSVRDLLEYVIWGSGDVAERIWNGCRSKAWKIQGIGLSTLGELVGWARPDEYPPRNMRTSKGLRALGHRVNVG